MKNQFLKLRFVLAIPLLLTAVHQAEAASAPTSMPVTATVAAGCTNATAATLAFGTINQNTTAIDTSANVTFTCTNTTPYYVSIGAGSNATGAQNRMKNSTTAEYINYNIYSDNARTTAFPTALGTLGTAPTGGAGTGATSTVTVYGRVPTGQTLPSPGAYGDTLPVLVSY